MVINVKWLVVFEMKSFKTKLKSSPSSNMKLKCMMKVTSLNLCYIVTIVTIKVATGDKCTVNCS